MKADGNPLGWGLAAFAIVAAAVALRLLALAHDATDLFVDEAQYWLWGQRLDFGYYSKPPLIGWLIRAVTDLAGSDSTFWVRMPGSVLHGATALILGALAGRIGGAKAGFWAAVLYISLPFVAVGSFLISTDTVMAPFFAAGLFFFWRAGDRRGLRDAALAGAAIGFAFLAKYAALYFWAGVFLAMALVPERRIGWRGLAVMALAFAVVIAPNVIWNLAHKLTTVQHTLDNVGWVRSGAGANLRSMAGFVASQAAVFGPVGFAALLWAVLRPGDKTRLALVLLSIIPLIAVTVQAFLGKAQANWAVSAYFAGSVLVALVLGRRGRWLAVGVNAVAALAVPILIVLAPWPTVGGKPLLKRYLGQAALSQEILARAKAEGVPVLADSRDLLADLFYTGQGSGVTVYAPRPVGRPRHYYEQTFPLPADYRGKVLFVSRSAPDCGAGPVPPLGTLRAAGGWAGTGVAPYLIAAECFDAAP